MIIVRRMTSEDIPAVVQIENQSFSMPWSSSAFFDVLEQKEYVYMVAIKGGEVVGYCGMYCVCNEGDITQVAVRNDLRGQGIGKKLLQDFMQNGMQNGIQSYTLEVRASNETAIYLYKSCGFVTEGIRKGFYEKPKEDALIMWKRI